MSEIYTMTSRMINQSKMLDAVSNNIANSNTTGFKRQSLTFKEVLDSSQQGSINPMSFSTVASTDTDFSSGAFKITNNPLDVSINGSGFFAIRRGEEGTAYTKNGHFMLNQTGQLVTANNELVLGEDKQPIDIPLNATAINITPTGDVKGKNGEVFGKLGVFNFDKTANLISTGSSSFVSPDQPTQDLNSTLIKGALEQSNVNAIQESVKMTEVSRAYQSAAKLIKTFEDLESKTIKDLYKVQ
jgi:flagellar basal-body rod protein FlgF